MSDIGSVTDEMFKSHLGTLKSKLSKEVVAEKEDLFSKSHDLAYNSFKNKFHELANHETDKLAEKGTPLSVKHTNELFFEYVKEIALTVHHEKDKKKGISAGQARIDVYNNTKFDDEHHQQKALTELAKDIGLNEDFIKDLYGSIISNETRSPYKVNELGIGDKGITQQLLNDYHKDVWEETFGNKLYKNDSERAFELLNELSDGKYIKDVDEDGKSKFAQYDTLKLGQQIIGHLKDKHHLKDETLDMIGLKAKKNNYES